MWKEEDAKYWSDKCFVCGERMKVGQRYWLKDTMHEVPWHADHRQPDGTINKDPIT